MVLVQNCSFLQDNSKSKTSFPSFTVPAYFPHSGVTHGQDPCACLPSFHLRHCELFHAVFLEFRSAAHPASLICSFPESLHLTNSLHSSTPRGMCFSPNIPPVVMVVWECTGWQSIFQLWGYGVSCFPKPRRYPLRSWLAAAFIHPLIFPANGGGDSYSFFLLCCFLKHPRADLWCVFPEHFLRLGTNFSLSPSLKLSVRVKVTLCSARHHSCPAEPSCLSLKFPMRPLCSHISFIFLFFQDCCQLKIQPFHQAVQTVA